VDAVGAAGGMLPEADADRVNLADRLCDGQQLYVPAIAKTAPPAPTQLAPQAQKRADVSATGLVNINTASESDLEQLPGIGHVLAARIVDYRTSNGPFQEPADIQQVRGIGPASFESLKTCIVVQ